MLLRTLVSVTVSRGLAVALAAALGVSALVGCSAERRGPVARTYHNLAARDNGYFLAREKIREIEANLVKSMVSDYNKTLPVLPPITEQTAQAVSADLEEVVKKASLPITRHKNSNWIDDSYLVIAQARYFKMEYDEAQKTFKYINTTSKDPNVRHAALIGLMRTFMNLKEIDNAVAVSDMLDKERGTPQNARDLFLTRAQLHIIRDEPEKAIVNLRLAIPEIRQKNERSRIRFILGQLYQQQGQDALAYEQYRRILKRNPPYELDLFTKLNLAQVTQVKDLDQRTRIEKYLNKLSRDPKNLEYRDKIFYEMARLEYRQQHYTKALDQLAKSSKASPGPQSPQKPYTYLLAARIAYDNLQNYRLAQRYYDSTSQVMPPTAREYEQVKDRADVLNEFVKNLDIVERQDSLQEMARLDSTTRNQIIDKMIAVELAKRDAEARKQAAIAEAIERQGAAPVNAAAAAFGTGANGTQAGNPFGAANNTGLDQGSAGAGGIWYFDNPTALASARADFVKRWGNRTLQDNWRLASLSQRNPAGSGGQGGDKTGGLADGAKGDSASAKAQQSPEQVAAAAAAALRTQYLQDLPKTPEDFKTSDAQIEEALFKLARIYDQRLREPERAAERYEELLKRFPETLHAPESLYALYLLAQNAKDDARKRQWALALKQKYGKTTYAQLIEDPEFLRKQEITNARVRVMYDSAYAIFRDGLYPKAGRAVAAIRRAYPVNEISDKLALLDAMIVGHTAPTAQYRTTLNQFKVDYPTSALKERADALLATIDAFEKGTLNRQPNADSTATASTVAGMGVAPARPAVIYSTNKSLPHLVMVVYPQGAAAFNGIDTRYSDYNRLNHSSENLQISTLLFGSKNQLLLVKTFEDARAALNYAARQTRRPPSPLAKVPYGTPFQVMVISQDNLPKFYQALDLEGYMSFYQENYK